MPHRFHGPILGGHFGRPRDRERAVRAMAAVNAQLVSRSDGLVKLFTPAFDHTPQDPGYIKAYPPGLRENGGQYTHAAMWTVLAFALLGDGDRAANCSPSSIPSIMPAPAPAFIATRSNPMWCAPMSTRPRSMSAAADGRGTRARPAGCTAPRWRRYWASMCAAGLWSFEPCIPRALDRIRDHLQVRSVALSHRGGEPERRERRRRARVSRRCGNIRVRPAKSRLADDGRYHYGLVTLG